MSGMAGSFALFHGQKQPPEDLSASPRTDKGITLRHLTRNLNFKMNPLSNTQALSLK